MGRQKGWDRARTILQVQGTVAPGYERVKLRFAQFVADGLEDCAQVCAFVEGRKVVDLWFSRQPGYSPTSMQNIFSSGKSLTSLVVAMLADRGHLRYEQKVTDIWPEFGANGKADTTIAMVMRHEAGLAAFDRPLRAADLTAANIRRGRVSGIIAAQTPRHVPGTQRVYHGVTRGWIVNEIVRRADPKGRTIGQFIAQEVAAPLGMQHQLAIGLPAAPAAPAAPLPQGEGTAGRGGGEGSGVGEGNVHDVDAKFYQDDLWFTWWQLLLPRALGGGKVPMRSKSTRRFLLAAIPFVAVRRWWKRGEQPGNTEEDNNGISHRIAVATPYPRDQPISAFNLPEVRQAEIPSANAHASARALAAVASAIAEGGALGGARLLSPRGVALGHGSPKQMRMFGGYVDSHFTNAGWNEFKEESTDGRDGYCGWMGLGGSVMQWHRECRIGFGYAKTLLELTPGNETGAAMQAAVLQCAREQAALKKVQQQNTSARKAAGDGMIAAAAAAASAAPAATAATPMPVLVMPAPATATATVGVAAALAAASAAAAPQVPPPPPLLTSAPPSSVGIATAIAAAAAAAAAAGQAAA